MPNAIVRTIDPRARDLGGGFHVRRVLPFHAHKTVGPFIFFDHFGPVEYAPGDGFDVRPHPHIGLATVTYLFEGAIRHQDSLGSDLVIRPGAVNWMTAGHGIVHSERTPAPEREAGQSMHGLQTWVALPRDHEDMPPSFIHHAAESLPTVTIDGADIRVLAGTKAVICGGAPLDGPRNIDWNFVASTTGLIDQAKQDWNESISLRGTERFPLVPGDDTEWIPLP